MTLLLALLLVGTCVFQWLTQEVAINFWGIWRGSIHKDEWPVFYWSALVLEVGLAGSCVYWFFT